MLKAAWKSLLGHKLRLLLSTLAVVLGIAFLAGSLVFTGMLRGSVEGLTKGTVADVNVTVEGAYDAEQTSRARVQPEPLTPSDIDRIAAVDGVAGVVGTITTTTAFPLDQDGRVTNAGMAPGIGSNWIPLPAFDGQPGVVLKSGHEPQADDQVVVDPNTLTKSGLAVGDQVEIAVLDGTVTKTIVGTASWGTGGSMGASYVFFTDAEAQRLFLDGVDGYQTGWVHTADGADRAAVAAAIDDVLPDGYQAYTGEQAAATMETFVSTGLSFMNTFFAIFAAVALIVASFLIVNTFAMLVAQRARELALYRALGASRAQVRNLVLVEAVVIGLVGGIGGLLLGMALAAGIGAVMTRLGMDLGGAIPAPDAPTIATAIVVAVSVTVISALRPAIRAGSVPPVAAMTGAASTAATDSRVRQVVTLLATLLGAAGLLLGSFAPVPEPMWFIGIGALVTLLGVTGLTATIGRPLLLALGALYRRLFGQVGHLARLNTLRQPRRTAATASALMIGLTLVTTLAILGSSTSTSMNRLITDSLRGDFIVTSRSFEGVPASVVDDLRTVSGVAEVRETRRVAVPSGDETLGLVGMEPSSFDQIVATTLVSGRIMAAPDEIMLAEQWAADNGHGLGDVISVTNPLTQTPTELHVVGIFTNPEGITVGNIYTTIETEEQFTPNRNADNVNITLAPGADRDTVRTALDDVLSDQPLLSVMDQQEYADSQTAMINTMLYIIYALLGMAIVIAILGIVNTLALSVVERTREIGLLRAVGLKRAQMRRMITLESVSIAVLGAVIGVVLGTVFGVTLRSALADDGLTQLTIPWAQLGAFVGLSVLVGVLAAIWPAQRAARLDILAAIATE